MYSRDRYSDGFGRPPFGVAKISSRFSWVRPCSGASSPLPWACPLLGTGGPCAGAGLATPGIAPAGAVGADAVGPVWVGSWPGTGWVDSTGLDTVPVAGF